MPRFFRVTLTNPPTLADFRSDKERGRPPPRTAELAPLWDGLSVMDTEDGAREIGSQFPANGSFVASLDIEDSGPIRYERTLRRPGHYTLWGDPARLLERVQSVVPI
jgi:hypothetical protein